MPYKAYSKGNMGVLRITLQIDGSAGFSLIFQSRTSPSLAQFLESEF